MCRWHSMNRKEKCRCISLVLAVLLGIAGVTASIYGSVKIFRVSQGDAQNDGLGDMLSAFYNCHDVKSNLSGDYNSYAVDRLLFHQCIAPQLPARIATGFAAAFMILAIICAPCAFKKDKWFGFTMWSTLAISTTVLAMAVVAYQAAPVASHFADCRNLDDNTVQVLQNAFDGVCVKGPDADAKKASALKWMCKLCTFFGGSVASVASLLLLFMIKSCRCCNPSAGCCGEQQSAAAAAGQHPCRFRRAVQSFRSRFCRRSRAQEDELPQSAPSYYEVHPESAEGASEDAGAGPYGRVN